MAFYYMEQSDLSHQPMCVPQCQLIFNILSLRDACVLFHLKQTMREKIQLQKEEVVDY